MKKEKRMKEPILDCDWTLYKSEIKTKKRKKRKRVDTPLGFQSGNEVDVNEEAPFCCHFTPKRHQTNNGFSGSDTHQFQRLQTSSTLISNISYDGIHSTKFSTLSRPTNPTHVKQLSLLVEMLKAQSICEA